jgi:hypothetical protein
LANGFTAKQIHSTASMNSLRIFLKTVGLYRARDGYPVYGMRVVRQN